MCLSALGACGRSHMLVTTAFVESCPSREKELVEFEGNEDIRTKKSHGRCFLKWKKFEMRIIQLNFVRFKNELGLFHVNRRIRILSFLSYSRPVFQYTSWFKQAWMRSIVLHGDRPESRFGSSVWMCVRWQRTQPFLYIYRHFTPVHMSCQLSTIRKMKENNLGRKHVGHKYVLRWMRYAFHVYLPLLLLHNNNEWHAFAFPWTMRVSVWLIDPSLYSVPVYLALECQHTHTNTYAHDRIRRWWLRLQLKRFPCFPFVRYFCLRRRYTERLSDLFFYVHLFVVYRCIDVIQRDRSLCLYYSLSLSAAASNSAWILEKGIWCERNF